MTDYILTQKDIMDNSSPCNKSSLILTYHILQYRTKLRTNEFENAFVNSVTTRYWPKVTWNSKALGFGNKRYSSCIPSAQQFSSSKEFLNYGGYIITNNRSSRFIESTIIAIHARGLVIRYTPHSPLNILLTK